MSVWEPYFRPTTRVHDSGFRCFECGYLQMGEDKKAKKKVVIARGVDRITNWLLLAMGKQVTYFDMDLLRDGNIRLFNHTKPLFWEIPGFSDAGITTERSVFDKYDQLDELWEKQNKGGAV